MDQLFLLLIFVMKVTPHLVLMKNLLLFMKETTKKMIGKDWIIYILLITWKQKNLKQLQKLYFLQLQWDFLF